MDIQSWLKDIGYEKYANLFEKQKVTIEKLVRITSANELKEFGVTSVVDRKEIFFEISKLQNKYIGKAPSSTTHSSAGSVTSVGSKPESVPRIHPSPQKELNEYEKEIIKYKKDLRNKTKELGPQHADVGDCHYDLGTSYYMNSEYENAIYHHNKSLEIRIKNYGEDDVDVVISYYQLGQDYYMNVNYSEAIKHHLKALKLQKELNEDDDNNEGVAAICFDLAKDYYYNSQYDEALKYHREALEIRQYIYANENTCVADVYYNIGLVYQELRQSQSALENFESAYTIYNDLEGEYSDNTLKTKEYISDIKEEINRTVEPAATQEKSKPEDPKKQIDELLSLGDQYVEIDDYSMAIAYYLKSLDIVKYLQNDDEKTKIIANIHFKLGTISKSNELFQDAIEYIDKAIYGYEITEGKNSFEYARSNSQLGDVFYAIDDYDRAIMYHSKALDAYSSIDNKPLTAWSHYDLGLDFYWKEQYEQSIDHFFQSLDIRLSLYGIDNESVADCYNRIGLSYYWNNEYELAIRYHNHALKSRKNVFGIDSIEFDESRYNLAEVYYYADSIELAKEYFKDSLDFRIKNFGPDSKETLKVKEWLEKF